MSSPPPQWKSPPQLGRDSVRGLPTEVRGEDLSGRGFRPGIVHIGPGAFHRAHQAVYTDELLHRYGGDWGIVAVSLHNASMAQALAAQDFLYTVSERDGETEKTRIVQSIVDAHVAADTPQAVIDVLADPAIRVVTLTISEKGYALDASGARLDGRLPTVQADRAGQWPPQTAMGYLVAALQRRRAAQSPGLTLISCDNLRHNGESLRVGVLELAELRDPELRRWIENTCAFPSTMVDRIVPATTAEQSQSLAEKLGVEDAAAVFTEPFRQWVIERRFAGPMPPWDRVGAEFVDDVRPFEDMKLRLLNASHSLLAWAGRLSGYATIAETMADPVFENLVARAQAREAAPTLAVPTDYPVADYAARVRERFANPALGHRCAQIATDSAKKIPERWLPVIAWHEERERPAPIAEGALAMWLATLHAESTGRLTPVTDPAADTLRAALGRLERESFATGRAVDVLQQTEGPLRDICQRQPALCGRLVAQMSRIEREGVHVTLAQTLASSAR